MGEKVVVLSPHLDDAVLSLGALVARLAAGGRRVEVWSVFTERPASARVPRRWRPYGDYATRRAEDEAALALLGATPHHLGLPERLWRNPRPRTLAAVFRGPATVAGFGCLDDVRGIVAAALATGGAEVYAPLGIGQHHDHLEVAVAALEAALAGGAADRIAFYEDYYAIAESLRRRHPVSRRRPCPPAASPGLAAPRLAVGLRLMALASRPPRLDDYVGAVRALPWRCDPHPVDGFEDLKIAAVAAYSHQLEGLGGRQPVERALRRAHRRRGGELVWRIDGAVPGGISGSA